MGAIVGGSKKASLAAVLICFLGTAQCAWAVLGDVDVNGVVNAVDVQLIINGTIGVHSGYNCDVNNDGVVNALDAQIVINASLGKTFGGKIGVPGVVGMTQSAAQAAITAVNLSVGAVTREYSVTVPVGNVVAQSPTAGASALLGGPVDLVVSMGPRPVSVPDVAGMAQADAQSVVTTAGLVVGIVTQAYSATVAEGDVERQDPAAGSQVLPGTPVALVVSKGRQPVLVPNVVGMTQAGAESAIVAAGLTPGTLSEAYSATVSAGIVIGQNPEAGGAFAPGSAVDIVVSAGPQPVDIPNVVDMTQDDALTAITAADLTVGTITEVYDPTVPPGHVVSQTLTADGTAVDLVISKGPYPVGPSASYTATPRTGGTPLNVQFSDTSNPGTESITSWSWDFGDGSTATSANPVHTYTQAGTYSVSLTVTTSAGSDTDRRIDYIAVSGALADVAAPGAQIVNRGQIFDGQTTVPYWDLVGIVKDGKAYLYCPAMGAVELTDDASRRAVGWWLAVHLANNQKQLDAAQDLATGLTVSPDGIDRYSFENRNNRWAAVVNSAEPKPVFIPGQGPLIDLNLVTALAAKEPLVNFLSAPTASIAVSGNPVYTYGSIVRSPLWPYILGTSMPAQDAPSALLDLVQNLRGSADAAMAQDADTFVRLNAVDAVTLIFDAISAITGQFPGECANTLVDDLILQSLKPSLAVILTGGGQPGVDSYLSTLDGLAQDGIQCAVSDGTVIDDLIVTVLNIVAAANWIVDDALVGTIDPTSSLAYAQVEGIPPSVTSFRINAGEVTASRTATLNSACTGGPTEYMASESSNFSGATWKTYSTAASFTITSVGNGTKTVYFKVKNDGGESTPISDTITLNESGGGTEETIILPGNVPMEMVWIPAGTFTMGRYLGEQDSYALEDPQHQVTFASGSWLGKYELTKAQWTAVMGTTPWTGKSYVLDDPDSPAVYITWNAAQLFIEALNNCTGKVFRLPSEALWEYACRAGTSTRFYWGDDPTYTNINDYAWWDKNAYSAGERYAHVVGLKPPNAFGLYDMSGNVWEWCEDDWHPNYTGAPSDGLPWVNSSRGTGRVVRGGGWSSYGGYYCRSANRIYINRAGADFYIGVRVSR